MYELTILINQFHEKRLLYCEKDAQYAMSAGGYVCLESSFY